MGQIGDKKLWENIGLDESNREKYPAIYVAVTSDNPQDIKEKAEELEYFPKIRRPRNTDKKLEIRDYSFLLLTDSDNDLIKPDKKIGIILASLLYQEPISDHLNIYVDGQWTRRVVDFTEGILSELTGLERDLIEIHTGKDLDRKIGLVNIADEAAYWLLKRSLETLREIPYKEHKKNLLLTKFKEFL
jgi:hypothetical protein